MDRIIIVAALVWVGLEPAQVLVACCGLFPGCRCFSAQSGRLVILSARSVLLVRWPALRGYVRSIEEQSVRDRVSPAMAGRPFLGRLRGGRPLAAASRRESAFRLEYARFQVGTGSARAGWPLLSPGHIFVTVGYARVSPGW